MIEVVATIIELQLSLEGDAASFSQDQRSELAFNLRQQLTCQEPMCNLELRVSPGSIVVAAAMTIPESSGATATSAVEAAATQLVSQPVDVLSASLDVTVVSAAPISVATGQSVTIQVAPPPPPRVAPIVPGTIGALGAQQGIDGGGIALLCTIPPVLAAVSILGCWLRRRATQKRHTALLREGVARRRSEIHHHLEMSGNANDKYAIMERPDEGKYDLTAQI